MSEPQYRHYRDLPRYQLGLMSGEVWHRDPKMLGIHLARYKFVAKMLAGKEAVAEIGCGDGFYSRVVAQEVEKLDLFDLDPSMCVEHAEVHNIVSDRELPGNAYDAIYSLDVFEHIRPDKFRFAVSNVAKSLLDNGVFIIGMPSLESQVYASEASKIGHVNCMSGVELEKELNVHFNNVFMFSMNDETLHTGFMPMSHYLLGVCVGVG